MSLGIPTGYLATIRFAAVGALRAVGDPATATTPVPGTGNTPVPGTGSTSAVTGSTSTVTGSTSTVTGNVPAAGGAVASAVPVTSAVPAGRSDATTGGLLPFPPLAALRLTTEPLTPTPDDTEVEAGSDAEAGPDGTGAADTDDRVDDRGDGTGNDDGSAGDRRPGREGPDGTERADRDLDTDRDGLTIVAVVPDHGPAHGGTAVTITGRHFPAHVQVTLGGAGTYQVRRGYTGITVLTPAGSPGTVVDAIVYERGGNTVTLPGAFRYDR